MIFFIVRNDLRNKRVQNKSRPHHYENSRKIGTLNSHRGWLTPKSTEKSNWSEFRRNSIAPVSEKDDPTVIDRLLLDHKRKILGYADDLVFLIQGKYNNELRGRKGETYFKST